ncbi:PAS domain-containing protein [Nonomuraea thailandensis]
MAGRAGLRAPRRQRDIIDRACAAIGDLVQESARHGRPIRAGSQPRLLGPRPVRPADPRADLVALECLNRLPEGYCMLDVEGRATLVSAPAADLLGLAPSTLLGRRLWEVLPWLADPSYEDRYRAAVIGRQTTQFATHGPDGRQLTFCLYPGLTGITLRITPGAAPRGSSPAPPPATTTRCGSSRCTRSCSWPPRWPGR